MAKKTKAKTKAKKKTKKKNTKNRKNSRECWSHIIMFTRIVSTLHTLPMTENDVALITALSANEK